MDLIKPIERVVDDIQGQGIALADVMRERQYQQRAHELPAVKQTAASQKPAERRTGTRQSYAQFEVSRDTHDVTVRIIDAETGELIRTVPPEDLAREIAEGNLHPDQLRRRAVLV
jgi:uncharacterized FlaG/YvyC family protein